MGTDKGLLQDDAGTWAAAAAEKLASLDIPVVISVNGRQAPAYRSVFFPIPLIEDRPALQLKGPLAGLLSVHLAYSGEDLFLLACDMPRMQTNVLQALYKANLEAGASQVILFTTNGQPEPLCAIYRGPALVKIVRMLEQQLLIKHSMKFMLEQLEVKYIVATEDQYACFSNINTPDDVNFPGAPAAAG